jgi:hypothetical protein
MYLVGFIIQIFHDASSHELQNAKSHLTNEYERKMASTTYFMCVCVCVKYNTCIEA